MMKLHIKISVIFFSVDKDPEVSFDDESNEFLMPLVFGDKLNSVLLFQKV